MSKAAKTTFALSVLFTSTVIFGVHYMQELDADTRRQGLEMADERRVRSKQRIENELEAKRQMILREELQKEQPVSSKSFTSPT